MELKDICRAAVQRGASDIHLQAGQPPMLRVQGQIEPVPQTNRLPPERLTKMAWDIMTPIQRERFTESPDLDLSWHAEGIGRFRINVFRQNRALGMVLRIIPDEVPTIDELQLPQVIKDIATMPRGLVIVTGTTGSG